METTKNKIRQETETSLQYWREDEKKALELLQIVGELRFDRSIELVIFRRGIYDCRPSEVLNNHLYAANYVNAPITIDTTLSIAKTILNHKEVNPCILDIGKMAVNWLKNNSNNLSLENFVNDSLLPYTSSNNFSINARDVILYGFGRIGRLLARRLIEQTGRGEQLRLRAIVLRPQMKDYYSEAKKRAALLMTDSVHGDFRGTVTIAEDGKSLTVNGNKILLIYAKDPADIDYTEYGLKDALVIDNTGVWRDGEALKAHLRPGVEHVMLTAPGKLMPNIVYGVNHETLDLENTKIFCAASCTTNAISPILKVMNESLGIEKGHIETVHAYTSDQNLLDNFHKKPRRGRSAPLNMVLTSTGAAEAIESVMPELKGKFTGNAVRVPTPNVSLAIMSLSLNTPTTKAALNQILKDASLHGPLVEQIQYSDSEEYVSTDAVGMTSACVLDAPSTIVSADGKNVIIYAWYDNEYGYTCQVVRVAKHAAQVRRPAYF
ncbi:MAG TPA: glyceraldehyde-3-phosphate dehydrogenase [Saprospiraceae bacterium]|nr:glyceraldehyde-3-phosphate dehydrogenase [Saprospiraceae bacterium]HND16046.1 glyceraldehyde-3-phosphate dehydrogenase [Saprospiraceae bacterium]HNL29326.1 glyceraldehyde-3-phosphate dehydrogenase [Saprospiraceae bacterium]